MSKKLFTDKDLKNVYLFDKNYSKKGEAKILTIPKVNIKKSIRKNTFGC